jgi:4-aminobutyrate aminotransferase
MQQRVRAMLDRHPSIGQVRGKGLMIGIELVTNRVTQEPARQVLKDLLQAAFERGLLLLPCGASTVRFMPALNISTTLVEEGLAIFDQALTVAEERFFGKRNGR